MLKKSSAEYGGIEYCSYVPKHGHREVNMQVSNALWWPRGTQQAPTAPSPENPSNSQGSCTSLGEGQWNAAPCLALTTVRPRLYNLRRHRHCLHWIKNFHHWRKYGLNIFSYKMETPPAPYNCERRNT